MSRPFCSNPLIGIDAFPIIANSQSKLALGVCHFCLDQVPLRMAERISQGLACDPEDGNVCVRTQRVRRSLYDRSKLRWLLLIGDLREQFFAKRGNLFGQGFGGSCRRA